MLNFGRKKKESLDNVIIEEKIVSVSFLKKKARNASIRFWCSLITIAMMATMTAPYLSMASVAATNSSVFTGQVIPGYSMGGVEVAAYGIDLNKWASVTQNTVVGTNYGIWNKDKANKAAQLAPKGTKTDSDYTLSSEDKSVGWQAMTGKTNYSQSNPNGSNSLGQSNQYDTVSPYRTPSDVTFWDNQTPTSSDNASANITVSLYPDFVVLAKDPITGYATMLTNPDDVLSSSSENESVDQTTSKPYYIPLSTMFSAYGLTDVKDTYDDLIKKVADDVSTSNGIKHSPKLDALVSDDSNNLLYSTHYSDLNGKTGESSDSFNPYPYSMVFQKTDSTKGTVTSSIYGNNEAYVFFSPASAYNKYITLRSEYDSIVSVSGKEMENHDPVKALQLGYYLSTMSILESYLSEALPQDMTRGYVGPTEPVSISGEAGAGNTNTSSVASLFQTDGKTLSNPEVFQRYSYATLMYDVAKMLKENKLSGLDYKLGQTNAIMDTLSTFGYSHPSQSASSTGVMKGMTRAETYNRLTAFTPYSQDNNTELGDGDATNPGYMSVGQKNAANAGFYTPSYYPVQQHRLPASEKTYRFSIMSVVPYETVVWYLNQNGFSGSTALSYTSGKLDTMSSISGYTDRVSSLANQYSNSSEDTQYFLNSEKYDPSKSIVCNPKNVNPTDETEVNDAAITQTRVDSALMGYASGSMTSDNVHDFVDVVRSISGLKYETWNRYYNPLKSEGGDQDLFLTRVSPAQTTYMPSILFTGYEAAGGNEINSATATKGSSFDYYSTPSFAPCLASHTASDTYYGSLNYEQRAFYSTGFIKTLSSTANIPAVGAAAEAQEQVNNVVAGNLIESDIMKQNLTTIYQACQRLAYIDVFQQTMGGDAVGFTTRDSALKEYIDEGLQKNGKQQSVDDYMKSIIRDTGVYESKLKDKEDTWKPGYSENIVTPDDKLFNRGESWYLKNYVAANIGIGGGTPLGIDDSVLFSANYRKTLLRYIDTGGSYSWMGFNELQSFIEKDDIFDLSIKGDTYQLFTGGIGTLVKNKGEYVEKLNEACDQMFVSIQSMNQDLELLTSAMPSQMQNCLAWADYQNPTDSEKQYQADPTDTNVTVNVGGTSGGGNGTVRNINDAKAAGAMLAEDKSVKSADIATGSTYQARMVRGVEGATWTATVQPACYTTSATIGRINALSTVGGAGTSYPYSGITNGRLLSGTDQYTMLQAHVIDYTSISSGIAGDLASRVRGQVVSISNPEYGSLIDFLDIVGNISALLGEAGKGWINLTGGAFEGMMFSKSETSDSTLSSDNITGTAAPISNTGYMNSIAAASSFSNITMDRASASGTTFNTSTGQMSVSNGDSSSPQANAAVSAVEGWGSQMLLAKGTGSDLYALIQSFALVIVMLSLLVIAFNNFYAYAKGRSVVKTQTQLKTVLPRSVIAIMMIGLPPINGGIGFQGGCYLVLQAIGSLISEVGRMFTSLDGGGLMTMWSDLAVSALGSPPELVSYIFFAICAFIIGCMFIIGCVAVFIQGIMLFGFFLIGPLVWAMYVWPYDSTTADSEMGKNANSILGQVTGKLTFGHWSNHKIGSEAPMGWITAYTYTAILTIAWALVFWVVTMVFAGATGASSTTGSATATAAILGTGSPAASSAVANAAIFSTGNEALDGTANFILATIIAVFLFVFMIKSIARVTADVGLNSFALAQNVGRDVKNGLKDKVNDKVSTAADKTFNKVKDSEFGKKADEKIKKWSKDKYSIDDVPVKAAGLARSVASTATIGKEVFVTGKADLKDLTALGAAAAISSNEDKIEKNRYKADLLESLKGTVDVLASTEDKDEIAGIISGLTGSQKRALEQTGILEKNKDGLYTLVDKPDCDDVLGKIEKTQEKLKHEMGVLSKTNGSLESGYTGSKEKEFLNSSKKILTDAKATTNKDALGKSKDQLTDEWEEKEKNIGVLTKTETDLAENRLKHSDVPKMLDGATALDKENVDKGTEAVTSILTAAALPEDATKEQRSETMKNLVTRQFGNMLTANEAEELDEALNQGDAVEPSKAKQLMAYKAYNRFRDGSDLYVSESPEGMTKLLVGDTKAAYDLISSDPEKLDEPAFKEFAEKIALHDDIVESTSTIELDGIWDTIQSSLPPVMRNHNAETLTAMGMIFGATHAFRDQQKKLEQLKDTTREGAIMNNEMINLAQQRLRDARDEALKAGEMDNILSSFGISAEEFQKLSTELPTMAESIPTSVQKFDMDRMKREALTEFKENLHAIGVREDGELERRITNMMLAGESVSSQDIAKQIKTDLDNVDNQRRTLKEEMSQYVGKSDEDSLKMKENLDKQFEDLSKTREGLVGEFNFMKKNRDAFGDLPSTAFAPSGNGVAVPLPLNASTNVHAPKNAGSPKPLISDTKTNPFGNKNADKKPENVEKKNNAASEKTNPGKRNPRNPSRKGNTGERKPKAVNPSPPKGRDD